METNLEKAEQKEGRKLTRSTIFQEMADVDELYSPGFVQFLLHH